jgi:hypothetical protein
MSFNDYLMVKLVNEGVIDVEKINKEEVDEEKNKIGKDIAKKLGVRLVSWWPTLNTFLFNDDHDTNSSFTGKNFEDAEHKLKLMRDTFKKRREELKRERDKK